MQNTIIALLMLGISFPQSLFASEKEGKVLWELSNEQEEAEASNLNQREIPKNSPENIQELRRSLSLQSQASLSSQTLEQEKMLRRKRFMKTDPP